MNRRDFALGALAASAAFAASACKRAAGGTTLPELGVVGAFALRDQHGRPFDSADLAGDVWIASFFFTRCPTVCPRVIRTVKGVQRDLAARSASVELVSFTVDPENDTPAELLAYAAKFEADLGSWTFLTGDISVVKRTCVEGFKIALEGSPDPAKDHYGILHGTHLVLVDGAMKIRGYYRSSDAAEMTRLVEAAATLSA